MSLIKVSLDFSIHDAGLGGRQGTASFKVRE